MRQYQSEQIERLAEALAKAQSAIKPAEKSADNPFFKSKYADLPAVVEAARAELGKNGLSVTQMTDIDEKGDIALVTQLNHSSGQWIRGWYPVKPIKSDPQGVGSALTYARRYAFAAITGVVSVDEDDDGNAASDKRESSASKIKKVKAFQEALLKSEDPAAFWAENEDILNDARRSAEPESAMRGLLTTAAQAVKQVILNAADPGIAWHEQSSLIGQIKTMKPDTLFQELVKAGSTRKEQIAQDASLVAGMPEGFNRVEKH